MPTHLHLRRLLAVLLALALVAAACGGGDDGTETGGSSDTGSSDSGDTSGDDTEDVTGEAIDETATGEDAVSAEDVTPDEIQQGGTLRVAMQTEAGSLNPTNTGLNRAPIMVATAIFDTLTVVDAEGQWHNNVSESWTPNDDFSSWDVKIRDGITFTDGEVMNADAVIRTVEAFLADPLVSLVFKPAFDPETPIEKVDDMTVRINATGPSAQMPYYFAEQLGMIGSPKWLDDADFDPSLDQVPVGSGPFKIEERVQDQRTVLVPNEDWWRLDDQEIYLDRIELFPIPQEGSRTDQFLVGDLDITHGTDTESLLRLREDDGDFLRVEDNSGEEFMFLLNASKAPFDDIRVRQAATHAYPKQQYLDFITEGIGLEADSLWANGTLWHVPSIVQQDDMPELAGPLIEDYCGDNPDNCTDGKVDIELQHDTSLTLDRIASIVSDAWSDYFNVTLDVIPNDQHIQQVIFGQYDTATWRYHGFSDPDVDTAFLDCSTILALSINWSRNCNEERDELLRAQRATQDFDERYEIWTQIQENLRDSYQYIFVVHTNWTVAANSNVGGVCDATSPDGASLPCQQRGVVRFPQMFLVG